jgi:translation initiation factor IF-3
VSVRSAPRPQPRTRLILSLEVTTGSKVRLNGDLRGTSHVRVIAADGEMLGVMTFADALRAAMSAGLDLVEVNPKADPPVCKILDFRKYKYEEKMRVADAKNSPEPEEPDQGE